MLIYYIKYEIKQSSGAFVKNDLKNFKTLLGVILTVVFVSIGYFEKTDPELKNKIEWIIPNAQKNMMEPILMTLEAGGSCFPDNPHEGEEFGYILSGSLTLHLGAHSYRVKKGESFYFTPDKKHYISTKSGATLIWVSTPPSF